MKKLLLLMLLASTAFAQDLSVYNPYLFKVRYYLSNGSESQWGDSTDAFIYSPSANTVGISRYAGQPTAFWINVGDLVLNQQDEDEYSVVFQHPDGALYLTSPHAVNSVNVSGTRIVSIPFDSGRVDVHNVTSLGQDAFTGTATHDTVTIAGALPTDMYVLTPYVTELPATTNTNDILYAYADTGRLIVIRPSGGSDGLAYTWRRFRQ